MITNVLPRFYEPQYTVSQKNKALQYCPQLRQKMLTDFQIFSLTDSIANMQQNRH